MFRLLSALAGLLLVVISTARSQTHWGADPNVIEIQVAGRNFDSAPDSDPAKSPYAFIAVGHPTELARQAAVKIPEPEILQLVNAALSARGFVPGRKPEEIKLGIIVSYGTGVLRPPYEFFGINPDFEFFRSWPEALQRLHRYYYAGSADDDELDRADTAEPLNYVKISAYDFQRFKKEKKLHLVWATMITLPARDTPLPDYVGRMIQAAAPHLGKESRDGQSIQVRTKRADVQIGPVEVVPSSKPANGNGSRGDVRESAPDSSSAPATPKP